MSILHKRECNYCKSFYIGQGKYFCSKKCHGLSKIMSLEMRFWEKVDKKSKDECWEWLGAKGGRGYNQGQIRDNNKLIIASRVSWQIHFGNIPDGLSVCHKCDNPPCVNPTHLFLGTHQDNMDDKVKRNRQMQGENQWKSKLTKSDILKIRELYNKKTYNQYDLSGMFGVGQDNISRIINKKIWK